MAKSSRTYVLKLMRGRTAPASGYPARAFRGLMSAAALFCAAAILSGCLLDPQVPSPALDVPDNFQRANGTNGHLPDDFSMFRSKSLTRLIGEARSANLDIAAAMARIEQADAQVRIASQPLIPLLDIGGSGSQNFSHKSGVPVKTNTVTAQFTASYELDFWGKNRATRYSAEAAAFQTRFDGAIIAIATDASVASTYFQAVAAKKRLTVSKANLATAVKELEAIKARSKAGTASGLDVAQQETLVANQNVKIPPLELAYEQNVHALAILLGQPPEGFGVWKTSTPFTFPWSAPDCHPNC
jgi:multidrug efflux system outer membrane protein